MPACSVAGGSLKRAGSKSRPILFIHSAIKSTIFLGIGLMDCVPIIEFLKE